MESLAAYSDSDEENKEEISQRKNSHENLVQYEEEEGEKDVFESKEEIQRKEYVNAIKKDSTEGATTHIRTEQDSHSSPPLQEFKVPERTPLDEFLPPKPPQSQCDPELQRKLLRFHALKSAGKSINRNLYQSKAFYNPDILEKLVEFCEIDEVGTNYPPSLFSPYPTDESDYYDKLSIEQNRAMDPQGYQAAQQAAQIEESKKQKAQQQEKKAAKAAEKTKNTFGMSRKRRINL